MAASKLEYLKRYMESAEEPKKKKVRKVKRVHKGQPNVKIIDANVDLKDVKAGSDDDDDDPALEDIREDAPEVAEVIDERPLELRSFKKTFQNTSQRHDYDAEGRGVPRRKARRDSSNEDSPPRKSSRVRLDSSDESPPRRGKTARHDSSDESPRRKFQPRRRTSSDASPPRRRRVSSSDASPPRRQRVSSSDASPKRRRKDEGRSGRDSDESPPRRRKAATVSSSRSSDIDSPPRRPRRQGSGAVDREIVACEVLQGPEAITLRRGKNEEEAAAKREQAEKEARRRAIYDKWAAGLVQQQQRQSQIEDIVTEANKPLARAADDSDLEDRLKAMDRDGDPMLAFLKKKKKASQAEPDRPRYNGPQPPPNRYNIWPGYRWDGVDRSNGFEAKTMSMKNDKMANEEQAYKWSIEDM